MIELYRLSGCPYCAKVEDKLDELGLEYQQYDVMPFRFLRREVICVIGEGPLSPTELADRLGYAEGTVRNYLNELVEFGLIQRSQLNRESGEFVNVYHSIDLKEMREETLTRVLRVGG